MIQSPACIRCTQNAWKANLIQMKGVLLDRGDRSHFHGQRTDQVHCARPQRPAWSATLPSTIISATLGTAFYEVGEAKKQNTGGSRIPTLSSISMLRRRTEYHSTVKKDEEMRGLNSDSSTEVAAFHVDFITARSLQFDQFPGPERGVS